MNRPDPYKNPREAAQWLRKKGATVRDVRVRLEELGMIPQDSRDDMVYDEIARPIRKERGRPFHPDDEDLVRKIEAEEAEDENQRILENARAVIEDSGTDLSDDETKQIMDRVVQGERVEDALEAVTIANVDDAVDGYLDETPDEEDIPFDDTPVQPQPRRDGEVAPQEGPEAARPARTE